MLKFEELLSAYEWVSAGLAHQNSAYVDRESGAVYWDSEEIETDEGLPDDIDDGTKYIAVPHKHDLDLGKSLVFEFVDEYIPREAEKVSGIFRRAGAYGRFKDLLERKNLLETWYEYEQSRTRSALIEWVEEHAIPYQRSSGAKAG